MIIYLIKIDIMSNELFIILILDILSIISILGYSFIHGNMFVNKKSFWKILNLYIALPYTGIIIIYLTIKLIL